MKMAAKKTNIKNYTSVVPATSSMSAIEKLLVEAGARSINRQYNENGRIVGFNFAVILNGNTLFFQLPVKVAAVEKVLLQGYSRPSRTVVENCRAQAERTAWKILSDWVALQVTMIKLEQAELAEIFLPYSVTPDGETLYNYIKGSNFKLLGDGK